MKVNLKMLKSEEIIILNILNNIRDNKFVTIEELKDSYKNEYDKIIEELFKSDYITNKKVHLTDTGILYLEQLEKLNYTFIVNS